MVGYFIGQIPEKQSPEPLPGYWRTFKTLSSVSSVNVKKKYTNLEEIKSFWEDVMGRDTGCDGWRVSKDLPVLFIFT